MAASTRRGWPGLVLVGLGILAAPSIPGSAAVVSAQTTNPGNAFALTALYPPSGLVAAPAGHDVALTWTAGQNGSGYAVAGAANGSSSDCSAATFTAVGTSTGTSYTDTSRYQPQGTWFCYQVKTTYGPWTSVQANPSASARIGFVATAVQLTNGGIAGVLDPGDTIVVTFNQPVDTSSGPGGTNKVCITPGSAPGAQLLLGSVNTSGGCVATESTNLGKLTGGGSTKNDRYNATYLWSNANETLTVTVGTRIAGSGNATVSGTWTFNPTTTATKVRSGSGTVHVCDTNSGGGACLPTATGSF